MIDPQTFAVFLAGALILNFTPGPDMAFTLATSARGGVRAGLAAALGVGVGSLGWALLTAAGLAALFAASDHAIIFVRLVGGAYLVFLGVRTFLNRRDAADAKGRKSAVQAFRAGAVTNLFNPKVGLFYLAFLPAFTNPEAGAVWMQILVLGALFSVTGATVLAAIAVAAGSARNRLARSPSLRTKLNTGAAAVFTGLGLYLLFSHKN